MAFSRSARISILLVVNFIFFLVEIIVGYYVHSLALVADSFHMLNDVLSLVVALWAIRLAERRDYSSKYTYGWQRAEVLGALVNGVFLLALCFTIAIESIQRFVEPQDIFNPKLVLFVGSAGLASNILGLFLFHEHGHSHGHSHDHGHHHVEESHPAHHDIETPDSPKDHFSPSENYALPVVKPQSFINDVDDAKSDIGNDIGNSSVKEELAKHRGRILRHSMHFERHAQADSHSPSNEGSLNMRGVFLHVMGDALGNVGVILTGLFIWLTTFWWRFYLDPAVSLVIVVIIFWSAMPLVRSASFILLQGSPNSIPVDDVRNAINQLDKVISIHELHIWQLSDTKLIASIHILVEHRADYMAVNGQIRKILHGYGVHSTTIQPEYFEKRGEDAIEEIIEGTADESDRESTCLLRCSEDTNCEQNTCCAVQREHVKI